MSTVLEKPVTPTDIGERTIKRNGKLNIHFPAIVKRAVSIKDK